jgi:hypothetical protein
MPSRKNHRQIEVQSPRGFDIRMVKHGITLPIQSGHEPDLIHQRVKSFSIETHLVPKFPVRLLFRVLLLFLLLFSGTTVAGNIVEALLVFFRSLTRR